MTERSSISAEAVRQAADAAIAAIREDATVADRVRDLLVKTGRAGRTLDLIALFDRIAGTVHAVIESELTEILRQPADPLDGVRRFFIDPRPEYSIDDLAGLWRITANDVRSIFADEIRAWDVLHPREPQQLRITWANVVGTSIALHLLRPFDIERALGEHFTSVRSERWRTVPVLLRIPRFLLDIVSARPPAGNTDSVPIQLERLTLRLLQAHYRSLFFGQGDEPGSPS